MVGLALTSLHCTSGSLKGLISPLGISFDLIFDAFFIVIAALGGVAKKK